jgi:hypothetical protein
MVGWDFVLGEHRVRVGHMRGMGYLAVLLANPDREIRAVELANGPSEPVLDDAARREYRQRLTELAERIDRHELAGDPDKADQVRHERSSLIAELAAAAGPVRSPLVPHGDDDRVRIAVGKAIRRALDRITAANPFVGQHLRLAVHTGAYCSYQPPSIDLAYARSRL